MLTRARKFALLAILACIGFIAAHTVTYAQPLCHCDIVNGCKVITFYDSLGNVTGNETVCPGTGSGDFNCSQLETPPTGPLNLNFPLININANAFSPTYGPITTFSDPTRISSNATVVSNQQTSRFPATVRFSFYARSHVAGVEYCSRTELVFRNNNVHSFRPFLNELFCLESNVEFYRCDDPAQRTVFVLNAGGSCVTLH